jgi:phosphatidylserine/phosphatidylglycerophosphate/cardiolipin synthase-like enzyme
LGRVYARSGVGEILLPLLSESRESLDIVSPYLSAEYTRFLARKAESGVMVRLMTSSHVGRYHQQALRVLAPGSTLRFYWPPFVAGLLGLVVLSVLGYSLVGVLVLGGSVLAAILAKRQPARSIHTLQVKIQPREFVHVKLYIVDGRIAVAGSANLTFSGMNHNVERVEVKESAEEVAQEIHAFEELWRAGSWYVVPAEQIVWKEIRWRDVT